MRMQKRQFRIGELAEHLNVKKFVIRFWEKEFALSTVRSNGGQRFYNEDDVNRFSMIKALLYEQGFTIAGARKFLHDTAPTQLVGSHKTDTDSIKVDDIQQQLKELKQQLIVLKELL